MEKIGHTILWSRILLKVIQRRVLLQSGRSLKVSDQKPEDYCLEGAILEFIGSQSDKAKQSKKKRAGKNLDIEEVGQAKGAKVPSQREAKNKTNNEPLRLERGGNQRSRGLGEHA